MSSHKNNDAERFARLADFRRRAEYSPESVYRHQALGWEYIPVHPFGDESALLDRLGLRAQDCRSADAWWSIDGDVTLLESSVGTPARLLAKATEHRDPPVYLVAVFDAPYITRAAFEGAMTRFAEAGFPRDPKFDLHWGDPWLAVQSLDGD